MWKKILISAVCILLFAVGFPLIGGSLTDTAPQEDTPPVSTPAGDEIQPDIPTDPVEPVVFERPDEMKAVYLDLDTLVTDKGEESVKKAIDSFVSDMISMEMNTVIVDVTALGGSIYNCHDIPLSFDFDVLSYLISVCEEKKLYLYADVNISHRLMENAVVSKSPTDATALTAIINRRRF